MLCVWVFKRLRVESVVDERTQGNDEAVRLSQAEGRKPWHKPVLTVNAIEEVTRNSVQNLHDANNAHS